MSILQDSQKLKSPWQRMLINLFWISLSAVGTYLVTREKRADAKQDKAEAIQDDRIIVMRKAYFFIDSCYRQCQEESKQHLKDDLKRSRELEDDNRAAIKRADSLLKPLKRIR